MSDRIALSKAETWIFDLDNTLYPSHCNLFAQVDMRMGEFISSRLGLSLAEAKSLQKNYFREYGTTLRGLMNNHGIVPEEFLGFVHDIDYSPVSRDERLERALEKLPGRKIIFTNGSVKHAQAVLERLGVTPHFEAIFDIAAAGFIPKPEPAPYDMLVEMHAVEPSRAVMVEDIAKNLVHPAALGMQTVWVRTDHEWSHGGERTNHVHHTTEDLTDWLEAFVEEYH